LLVDAEDPRALGEAIRSLIADGDRRRALGRASCERSGRYTLDAMARGTIEAYGGCLGASGFRAAVPV
jgi:glycosyltransferase involved in cell wall biosynthesis